ncbi:MAG: PrsW family glutamic-type intramembrane protease, partial [Leptolyngbyaceae bacterium]|nr:PrsW family glutamic-type intramembrane protease [Leptolyngbyaceae bacterium]
MVGYPPRTAILRYLQPNGLASLEFYPLSFDSDVKLGREPTCHIVLDSSKHTGVSRVHARIFPLSDVPYCWVIDDLESSNGTYVNNQRLHGQRVLQEGDRISLGRHGPRFIFECLSLVRPQTTFNNSDSSMISGNSSSMISGDSMAMLPDADKNHLSHSDLPGITQKGWFHPPDPSEIHSPTASVTLSQLFPIVSTGRDLTRKAYLIPGIITISFVVLLFITVGKTDWFNFVVAAYIASAAYYFVYRLCGRHKHWLVIVGSALITIALMVSPVLQGFLWLFRGVLPGDIPGPNEMVNPVMLLINMFFGAGLMEELLKGIPILLGAWIAVNVRSPYRDIFGVSEPLDGILIGSASAVGFTLMETLFQYVPSIVNDVTLQASGIDPELMGLQLLIPRILGSVSGHMAYSGYFGYFIGLSVLKPKSRWQTLMIGYLSASLLHALWNT